MNTNHKGSIAEVKALAHYIKEGYQVFTPFNDGPIDFLVSDSGDIIRVQCKHAVIRRGCVRFNARGVGTTQQTNYHGIVDEFFIYCGDNELCYIVPIKDVGEGSCSLRIDEPARKYPKIKWAKDYQV